MPPRIARSSVAAATPKSAKNKNRKRTLDAYAIASHATKPERINPDRLGEFLDDAPKTKRRRAIEDEEGSEENPEEDVPAKKRKTVEEEAAEGEDSEGNEWRLGGMRSDDEDSDLDSDEAFGESDEERFEGFAFWGSSGGKGKKVGGKKGRAVEEDEGMDLDDGDDGEEEDEDDFGEEGVDLATMLDDDDEEEVSNGRGKAKQNLDEDEASDEDDSASEEDDNDDQTNLERAARLRDRLDALSTSKPTTTPSAAPAALTVDDVLATLDPASRKQYSAALKTRKKSSRPTTLAAPLPKRQQDRLNREIASQKATEQLDRWRDTVVQNRRAEFLSFPLKDPEAAEPLGKERFVVDAKPQNELEANIQRIMEESGLAPTNKRAGEDEEAAILKSEELAAINLPVEEVMRRRAELRKARELLFREEIKAKRLSKIKSKSYRRVHRKERKREAERERELLGSGDDEDERETDDRKRAVARMSTKHRDSKFAKSLRQTDRGVWDEGAREAVIDEARRREELQRRIRGEDVADDNDSDVPSDHVDDEGFEGFGEEDEGAVMLKTLNRLDEGDEPAAEKGLAGLKFMRAADERRRAENDEAIERLRKEFAVEDGDEEESEEEDIEDQGLGRAVFGPKGKEGKEKKKKAKRAELEEGDEDEGDGEEEVDVITEKPAIDRKGTTAAQQSLGKDAKQVSAKRGAQLRAFSNKPEEPVEINTLATIDQPSERSTLRTKSDLAKAETNGSLLVTNPNRNDEASDSDPEPTNPLTAPNQSYHARAFAADTDSTTFAAEKTALVVSEDEKEESTHLPGWGSWTGAGLSNAIKRSNKRALHNPLFKTKTLGTKAENRRDRGLANVIISEKGQRKGKGYLAPVLPHGFETKEQYERQLRVPVGPEWVTKEVLQRNTRPRVVVRPGTVVEAMERPMV
ncbi:hypothetical protein LTR09_004915 [Extremus antarcticus]|uniref:Utp14-domain-containing protein n=1 Tax=Extremus antarcticus TaxID=702011 RepID=A0AAJ0DHG9_9PEZI|nr:hypothetical protein LTR09_004915 [Extremus antarcticus]